MASSGLWKRKLGFQTMSRSRSLVVKDIDLRKGKPGTQSGCVKRYAGEEGKIMEMDLL